MSEYHGKSSRISVVIHWEQNRVQVTCIIRNKCQLAHNLALNILLTWKINTSYLHSSSEYKLWAKELNNELVLYWILSKATWHKHSAMLHGKCKFLHKGDSFFETDFEGKGDKREGWIQFPLFGY